MNSLIGTPQVVIGIDTEGIFRDFEKMRVPSLKTNTDKDIPENVSAWYKRAVQEYDAIFLSTFTNPDILSFTNKFNSDSPQDQGLFVVEVLDPANIFEHRFLQFFYDRSYQDNITDANEWMTQNEFSPFAFPDHPQYDPKTGPMTAHNDEVGLLTKRERDLSKSQGERQSQPFKKSIMITFGVGNDARNWAPVQKASLVAMDYDLTREGLRKLTLKFVPNPGLLRYNDTEETEEYLTAGANINIQVEQQLMAVNEKRDKLLMQNPSQVVLDVISKSFAETTESPVILLLDNLKTYLDKKWKKACVTAINQKLPTNDNVNFRKILKKMAVSELDSLQKAGAAAAEEENRTTQLKTVNEQISKLEHTLSLEVWEGGLIGFEFHQAEEDLKKLQQEAASLESEETPVQQRINYLTDEISRLTEATTHTDKILDGLRKELLDNMMGSTAAAGFNPLKTARGEFIGKAGTPKPLAYDAAVFVDRGNEFDDGVLSQTLPGTWTPYGGTVGTKEAEYLAGLWGGVRGAYGSGGAQNKREAGLSGWRKGWSIQKRNAFQTWMKTGNLAELPPEMESVFQQIPGIRNLAGKWHKLHYNWDFMSQDDAMRLKHGFSFNDLRTAAAIEIDQVSMYSLYLKAAHIFFTGLGMKLVKRGFNQTKGTIPITGATPGTGVPHGAKTVDLTAAQVKTVFVQVSTKTMPLMRKAVNDILQSLGALTKLDPYVSCFSEISLVDRCAEEVRKSQVAKKYSALTEGNPDSIFLVTSYDVMSTLLQGKKLANDDPTHKNPVYAPLRRAFTAFRAEEPSINVSHAAYAKLFLNPDPDALMLPYNEGSPNALALLTNIDGKTFENNEKLNEYLIQEKIPVFNYGFKNSNILDFNFNLKPWYAYLLTLIPETLSDSIQVRGIKSFDIYKEISKLYTDEDSPEVIKGKIAKWYDESIDKYTLAKGEADKFLEMSLIAGVPSTTNLATPQGGAVGPWSSPSAQVSLAGGTRTLNSDHRENFIKVMYNFIISLLSKPDVSTSLLVSPENQDGITDELLTIRSKLSNRTFVGKITTLPLFSLMSMAKTLGSSSLLYFMEPEALASNDYKNAGAKNTWLSGEYYIVGYEVRITGSTVTTSFNVLKNASN